MQVQVRQEAGSRITDWMLSNAQDALIIDVITRLDQITAPLACYTHRIKHVLSAARIGTIAIEPGRTRDYVLGALHACARDINEETWSDIDAQLDRLREMEG